MRASIRGKEIWLEITYFKVYELSKEVALATNKGNRKVKRSYSYTKEGNVQLWVAFGGA